jgi:hypothetical protein
MAGKLVMSGLPHLRYADASGSVPNSAPEHNK